MADTNTTFALCIETGGSEDLEVRKIYEVLPDDDAARDEYLRIIDESGEDYLYPSAYFYPVELAADVRETLQRAA